MSAGKARWLAPERQEDERDVNSPPVGTKSARQRVAGPSTLTSATAGSESDRVQNNLTTPAGSHYHFRAQPGTPSQWIVVHSREDLRWFESRDDFEVRR